MENQLVNTNTQVIGQTVEKYCLTYDKLPAADRSIVDRSMMSIDILQISTITDYGADLLAKLGNFSNTLLTGTLTKDCSVVGGLLTNLITDVESVNPKERKIGFLIKFLQDRKKELAALKTQYQGVLPSIEKVKGELEGHRRIMQRDILQYGNLLDEVNKFCDFLDFYIMGLARKIMDVHNNELPSLRATSKSTGKQTDLQAVYTVEQNLQELDRKLYDLESYKTAGLQISTQVDVLQRGDSALYNKLQTAINMTIPMWKVLAAVAIGVTNQSMAVGYLNKLDNSTNQLFVQLAEMSKDSTLQVARKAEEPALRLETLLKVNEIALSMFSDLVQINNDGQQDRENGRPQLEAINASTASRKVS